MHCWRWFGHVEMLPHLPASARALSAALLSIGLLAIAAGFRLPLERSMPLHMLVQMPMLLGAGIACAYAALHFQRAQNRLLAGVARLVSGSCKKLDEYGIVGLTFFLLLSAYWMIPKALDDVLVSPGAEIGKFAAFFLAGLMLPGTLARANRVTQLFFLGNFAWMTAIVGMLYQDTAVRLCNAYLLDDQLIAGQGLVILSIAVPAVWFICAGYGESNKKRGIF